MRDSKTNPPLLTSALNTIRHSLPVGGSLPEDVWRGRHRFLVGLTWFHVVIIALTGPVFGYKWTLSLAAFFEDDTVLHTVAESLVVAFFAATAGYRRASREFRATAVSFGLMSASAIIVHLSGGYIEFHFHFFVMLVFLALYQDWVPYLFAVGFVAIHHGTVGVLWPSQVYNHPAAVNAPWTWAGIHAFFVLWSSVGSIIAWRFNERASAQTKLILDSAAEGIFGLNPQGITTFINPAAAKMLRLNEKKAVGQPLARLLEHTKTDGGTFSGGLSPIASALKDGYARRGTNEVFRRSDGTSFPADYDVTPMIEGDEVTGLVVSFRDTTERNRADREIQQNLQRIRALHEIDLAITSTLDLGNILDVLLEKIDLFIDYASASTVRLFDPRMGTLEPMACRNLDPDEWRLDDWKSGGRIPKMVFESQAPVIIVNVQSDPRTKNSEIFKKHGLFSYLGIPLIAKGKPLGVLGLYTKKEHPFSEQEVDFMTTLADQAAIAIHNSQLHEETKKQADALEKSNKIKDDFLSVMSHELRTPLIAITGYARLLEDQSFGRLYPEQLKAAAVIKARGDDLLVMIRSILETTKLEAGAMTVEKEIVDVKGLLDDLAKFYDAPLQKKVTVRWDYNGNLPNILTDGVKLKQILQNLVNNALQFTHQGEVTISARRVPEEQSIEFKVADTGVGISEEAMPVIFEKFRQVDSSETRDHEGMGLGLYIVKQFTDLLGGSIGCESKVGRGSIFKLSIPERTQEARHSQSGEQKSVSKPAKV